MSSMSLVKSIKVNNRSGEFHDINPNSSPGNAKTISQYFPLFFLTPFNLLSKYLNIKLSNLLSVMMYFISINIPNHLSHSPFFPHTSQTFPCEAQVPLNSPPLRNINLTDINIKNKEINPMVIRNTIISYAGWATQDFPFISGIFPCSYNFIKAIRRFHPSSHLYKPSTISTTKGSLSVKVSTPSFNALLI